MILHHPTEGINKMSAQPRKAKVRPVKSEPRVRWAIVDRDGLIYESTISNQRKGAWFMWRFAVHDEIEKYKKEYGLRAVKFTVSFKVMP